MVFIVSYDSVTDEYCQYRIGPNTAAVRWSLPGLPQANRRHVSRERDGEDVEQGPGAAGRDADGRADQARRARPQMPPRPESSSLACDRKRGPRLRTGRSRVPQAPRDGARRRTAGRRCPAPARRRDRVRPRSLCQGPGPKAGRGMSGVRCPSRIRGIVSRPRRAPGTAGRRACRTCCNSGSSVRRDVLRSLLSRT